MNEQGFTSHHCAMQNEKIMEGLSSSVCLLLVIVRLFHSLLRSVKSELLLWQG
jgi:hypothetical protein